MAAGHGTGYTLAGSVTALGGGAIALTQTTHGHSHAWTVVAIVLFAIGGVVLAATAAHHAQSWWRSRRKPEDPPAALPPKTSTYYDSEIRDLGGVTRSSADAVSDKARIDRVSGEIDHRPGLPFTNGAREEKQTPQKEEGPAGT